MSELLIWLQNLLSEPVSCHPFCEHSNMSALVIMVAMAANLVICLCCTCLSQEPLKVTVNPIPGQHFITTYRQEFYLSPHRERAGRRGDGDTELRRQGWEASAVYHRSRHSYQLYASMQDAMCRVGPNHVPNIFLVNMPVVSGLCKGIIFYHVPVLRVAMEPCKIHICPETLSFEREAFSDLPVVCLCRVEAASSPFKV